MSHFTCVDSVLPKDSTTIDILSFDIGQINMGIVRIRYNYVTKALCILNAMLFSISNPLQRLNENDIGVDEETTFGVEAFYAEPVEESELRTLNHQFSEHQHASRKRAKITEHTDYALQFSTNQHPQNVAKRRKKTLESKTINATLEKSWPLVFAQLPHALDAHAWISDVSNLDFILLEQQMSQNALIKAIFASVIMYFEMKRLPRAQTDESNWHLKPFIKSMSASKKLAKVTDSLHETWHLSEQQTLCKFMTEVQVRKLLKDHFKPTASLTNTESYSKRKISSKNEITHFFCSKVIKRARELSLATNASLPDVCPEAIVATLAREPVNNYAHWIVNQLKEKNNVTDAILQAFAWINECLPPE